jgi:hypothetical protein
MIWIDQECIDQKNREDKEFGIQSMDKVFERALTVLGALSLRVNTQAEWDALRVLKDPHDEVDEKFERESLAAVIRYLSEKGAIDMLEKILEDRWFQRSWILQVSVHVIWEKLFRI